MAPKTFDTLNYANRMIKVGFTREQAEEQAEAINEIISNDLATKQDLKHFELAVKKDLDTLGLKMTITFGCMLAAAIGILDFLLKR